MNSFRRWTTCFCSRFEDLLGQVENHEALAIQALSDMKLSLERARVQLGRIGRDCDAIEQERRHCQKSAAKWQSLAAREIIESDGLECLRRARRARRTAEKLRQRESAQREVEEQAKRAIARFEFRYESLLEQQRHNRREREPQLEQDASALRLSLFPESLFGKWENQLSNFELEAGRFPYEDRFAKSYANQDEERSLKEELSELRREYRATIPPAPLEADLEEDA